MGALLKMVGFSQSKTTRNRSPSRKIDFINIEICVSTKEGKLCLHKDFLSEKWVSFS